MIVVGAGPAGLAASVYAASEGSTCSRPKRGAGGQAGTSSRIENYLGFPPASRGGATGNSALVQAQRFGARVTAPCRVRSLGLDGGDRIVTLMDGTRLRSRCVLVSSGVSTAGSTCPGSATSKEPDLPRRHRDGGAAMSWRVGRRGSRGRQHQGQAIVFLANQARQVDVLLRGHDLGSKMSRYLVDRSSTAQRHGALRCHRGGPGRQRASGTGAGTRRRRPAQLRQLVPLFLFIGASPNSEWLRGCVEPDRHGFVVTGPALSPGTAENERWTAAGRTPFMLETSLPGVFAAGDVRAARSALCPRRRRGIDGGDVRARPPGAGRGLTSRPARRATTSVGLRPARRRRR